MPTPKCMSIITKLESCLETIGRAAKEGREGRAYGIGRRQRIGYVWVGIEGRSNEPVCLMVRSPMPVLKMLRREAWRTHAHFQPSEAKQRLRSCPVSWALCQHPS